MEQYTRRENIRVKDTKYEDNENTNGIVMKLASDTGVELTRDDISISRRLGATRNNNKPKRRKCLKYQMTSTN